MAALVATDWADGFIARHYALTSTLGTMLDPVTDRVLMVDSGRRISLFL